MGIVTHLYDMPVAGASIETDIRARGIFVFTFDGTASACCYVMDGMGGCQVLIEPTTNAAIKYGSGGIFYNLSIYMNSTLNVRCIKITRTQTSQTYNYKIKMVRIAYGV